jgi:hypothetical protein
MADLRKETHGAGSMNGVNTVVIAYDNRKSERDGKTAFYLDARIHPGDKRAPGQTNLALVSKRDEKSPTGFNNMERYSESQFDAIKEAAGDNVTDLTTNKGEVVGKIYGVKADLLITQQKSVILNTQKIGASDLSVKDNAEGKDIRTQIFDAQRAAKAARDGASTTAEAVVETPAVETPAVEEAKPAAKKPAARKPAAKKAPAARKPAAAKVLVGAGGVEAPASDEPELG